MTDWPNNRLNLRYHWKTVLIWGGGLVGACIFAFSVAYAAVLEIPAPNTTLSGIGVISGWKCEVNGPLTIRFDGGNAIPLVYGSERGDTRKPKGPCDDANSGFVAIMNWGNLGDGTHTAVVYDDGVEFGRSMFTVRRFREAFVTGASLTLPVQDFPHPGENAVFAWSQATQHLELADAFTASTPPDPPNCEGWATGQGDGAYDSAAWVEACLEAGTDPNARDADGNTPLHWIERNHADKGRAAALLLAAGADPNARNNQGRTPLIEALDSRDNADFEVTVVLLEAGADPNAQDQYGETALHYLSGRDRGPLEDIERALIRAGADPNLLNGNGGPHRCKTFECLAKKNYRKNR